MPKILSPQQIKQYQEEGFLSPIDVMSKDEALGYQYKSEDAERRYPNEINAENRNNAHLTFTFPGVCRTWLFWSIIHEIE